MEDGLISLIQFDRSFLSPILARLRAKSEPAHDFALGEMVEAYFWLSLGVEVQAFPSRETELLVAHRFTEAFHAFQGLFDRRGYLFAPSFEIRLKTSQNQKSNIAPAEGRRFSRPRQLIRLFHHGLSLETETVGDEALTTFFAALSVLRPVDLENILKGQKIEGILYLNVYESLLTKSFVQAARHMDGFRILDVLSRTDAEFDPDDAVLFRARINELTRWRLNLRVDNVREFLPIVVDRCNLQLPDGFRIAPADLSGWLTQLMADWGFTHEIGAPAS